MDELKTKYIKKCIGYANGENGIVLVSTKTESDGDKATAELAALKERNKQLQACHDAELGVCHEHCDEVIELREQLRDAEEKIKALDTIIGTQKIYISSINDNIILALCGICEADKMYCKKNGQCREIKTIKSLFSEARAAQEQE